LLENPAVVPLWRWLGQRFADRSLGLDTVPQLELGIDSLGWVELTLALERDLGIVLREGDIARIVTLRDLLREVVTHPGEKPAFPANTEARWLAPLGPGLVMLRVTGEAVIRCAMRLAFRLRVEGLELLPPDDPILICPNHVSYLDPFAVGSALPRHRLRRTYWGGWTGIAFNTRLRRLFSRVARIIPVDPDRAAGAGLALAGRVLERGWNLVWFPEGARSLDGKLQHFLPGIGALIEKRSVPVVPVFIEGSFASWPVGRRFPRFLPITVRFGKPLDPASLLATASGRNRDERIAEAVQGSVLALAGLSHINAGGTKLS
jgi:long-chain acyl-CoA synthetase